MENFNAIEKITFKQNALEDLACHLKKYKKVLIITSITPKTLYLNVLCNYLNDKQIDFEILCIKENVCNFKNLLLCCSYSQNCDCVLSFGMGNVCDLTKLTAFKQKISYVVCPTAIPNFSAFSNVCYFKNELKTTKIECYFPEKIFIDEGFIIKSPESLIFSAFSYIFSFYETYVNEYVNSTLFSSPDFEFLNKLKEILQKTEGLINYVEINKNLTLLNLMDNLIELFQLCLTKNISFSAIDLAANSCKNNFGKECLISSSTLLQVYKSFWKSNLTYQNIPNIERCLNILCKKGEKEQILFDFCENNKKFTEERFIFKAKAEKINILNILEKTIIKLSKISKKLCNLECPETKIVFEKNLYDNLIYHSLTSNNFQLNAILRLGYLNMIV